jgi:hypothetical protein
MILSKSIWNRTNIVFTVFSLLFIGLFYIVLSKYYFHYDDAFITYTFARNFAAGHGIVFYPTAQPIQGSSTFLYTILLAGLTKLTNIPTDVLGLILSIILFVVLQGLTISLINSITENNKASWQLNLLLFSFQVPLLFSLGLETMLVCCLLAGSILLILKKQENILALTLILIPLTRFDYAFFIPFIGLCVLVLWNKNIWALIKVFGPVSILTIVYLAFSKTYFGDWVPHSWIAKELIPVEVSGSLNWVELIKK